MALDLRRLQVEMLEMRITPGLEHFRLGEREAEPKDSWSRYFWIGTAPTGHALMIRYPHDYPLGAIFIETHPKLNTHHHYRSGHLCLMGTGEWSEDYIAATMAAIAFRFLRDYIDGRL